MESSRSHRVIDSNGVPLADHIQRVLDLLRPRLRRHFPALQDDTTVTEVLEEAGRRIALRERRGGPIEKLHGYAWVTLRSVATSRMRLGSTQLIQRTLESNASEARLASSPAVVGSVEEIERGILLREVLAQLSPEERLICVWKKSGFSSQEIAHFQGRSVAAVDILFFRAKEKIRRFLGVERADDESDKLARADDAPAGRGTTAPRRRYRGRECPRQGDLAMRLTSSETMSMRS